MGLPNIIPPQSKNSRIIKLAFNFRGPHAIKGQDPGMIMNQGNHVGFVAAQYFPSSLAHDWLVDGSDLIASLVLDSAKGQNKARRHYASNVILEFHPDPFCRCSGWKGSVRSASTKEKTGLGLTQSFCPVGLVAQGSKASSRLVS